jgi:acetylornithine/N-succinyldiaminopimelate aminotransferase
MSQNTYSRSDGISIVDADGNSIIDLSAGLASALGHRHPEVVAAIKSATDSHLGSVSDHALADCHLALGKPFATFGRCHLVPSANEANELALRIARSVHGGDKYRVITLLGSRHGDTFALRSASGQVESQGIDGPVAAGYRHVAPGDLAAIAKAIDANTAAICLSPIDWNRGGEAFEADYLAGVEAICRERELLLVMDSTGVPPGIGGSWFLHDRASIEPDILTASAGWTGGLPGGLVALSADLNIRIQAIARDDPRQTLLVEPGDLPLLRAVVTATALAMAQQNLLGNVEEAGDVWSEMLNETASGFDFVRSCVHIGLWTTIEVDLPAIDVARMALKQGLYLRVTSDTTLLICPPTNVTSDELLEAMSSLRGVLESVERETASS